MTQVRFDAADSLGLDPATALTFELSATRLLFDPVLDLVRLPFARSYPVTGSAATVIELAPTNSFGGGWAWRITWRHGSINEVTMYFVVPAASGVLNFEDLTIIDPSTLQPIGLASAWVTEIQALRIDLEAQIDAIVAAQGNVPPRASAPNGYVLTLGAAGPAWLAVNTGVAAHEASSNPHPAYLTTTEAGSRFGAVVIAHNTPAATWGATHAFTTRPVVTVLDSAQRVIFADVEYTNASTITVTHAEPQTGSILLTP